MNADETGSGRPINPYWIAIGVLVLVVLGMWLWMGRAVNATEERMTETARIRVTERTESLLGVTAQSLGLAVREAAIVGDRERIQSYLDRLVQEPGVEGIAYAEGDSVILATDRSRIGASLKALAPGAGAATSASVARGDDGWLVVVPITGLNARLGTLALEYNPEADAPPAGSDP